MQVYKLRVPHGAQEGDILHVSFDAKTGTISCVTEDEVKERQREQTNTLVPIVGRPMAETLVWFGEQQWPDVVRYVTSKGLTPRLTFPDFASNPNAFFTTDAIYADVPPAIHESSRIHYAACFTGVGQDAERKQFATDLRELGWPRPKTVTAFGLLFDLSWAKDKRSMHASGRPRNPRLWMAWSESEVQRASPRADASVYSFCAPQGQRFHISVRKNEEGVPTHVRIVEAAGRSLIDVTVHTNEGNEQLLPR